MSRPFLSHVITDDSALGGAVVERSLRFNNDDGTYLERTPSGAGNRKKWTFSAWIKRSGLGFEQRIFGGQANASHIYFETNEYVTWDLANENSSTPSANLSAQRYFRDPTAWFHLVCALDTDESTANNRMRMYINGSEVSDYRSRTNPSSGYSTNAVNAASVHTIGRRLSSQGSDGMRLHGYVAEVNFIDGYQYDASYFGYTESQTGIWRPKKYEGTYGTNGFHLDFSDNSSVTTLGIDKSPNGNDFTPNNFSVSSGKDGDSFIDTPNNNFPTLNPLVGSTTAQSLSDGNLTRSGGAKKCMATFEALNGKYYFEYKAEDSNQNHGIGVCQIDTDQRDRINTEAAHYFGNGEYKIENNSQTSGFASYTTGDIIGVAIDTTLSTPKVWFAKNNTWQGTGDPTTTGYSLTSDKKYVFSVDHTSGSGSSAGTAFFGAHQGEFNYDPPSGFKALSTKNLPPNVPSIIRPQKHFDIVLYTGNGSTNKITDLEFQPDFVWMKSRSVQSDQAIVDSVRGRSKIFYPSTNQIENTSASDRDLVSFDPNGFTLGAHDHTQSTNANGVTIAAWCWKAGGAAVSNTDGTITSQVSANKKAGFSIVSYTGDGSSGKTVGHGLDATPVISIRKKRDASSDWFVHYTFVDGTMDFVKLNSTTGDANSSLSAFTSTTLPVDDNTNQYVSYCWHDVPGYSKFGKYTGNGSSDGIFVHLGFRPAWLLVKNISSTKDWILMDSTRSTENVMNDYFLANSDSAEGTNSSTIQIDFLSNGFKWRGSSSGNDYINNNGDIFIYMAFAEQPGTTPFDTFSNAR